MDVRAPLPTARRKTAGSNHVQLEGPREGRSGGLRDQGDGVCHTDEFPPVGPPTRGRSFPAILGHEAPCASWSISAAAHQRDEGRSRHSALTRRNAAVPVLPVAQTNCARDPRHAGPGLMPGRAPRASRFRQAVHPLHRAPRRLRITPCCRRSRWRKSRGRALRQGLLYRLRPVTTGIGAVSTTAKVEQGAKAIVFGLGGIGSTCCRACGSPAPT